MNRAVLLSAAAACVVGCAAGPTEVRQAHPMLASIGSDELYTHLVPTGTLILLAVPSDPEYSIAADERVSLRVSTDGGDDEEILSSRQFCSPSYMTCHSLVVQTAGGTDVLDLQRKLGGRASFVTASVSRQTGGVWVYDPRHLPEIQVLLLRSQGVTRVERNYVSLAGSPPPGFLARLSGGIRFERRVGGVTPRNGIVEAASGEIVRVSYRQPDLEEFVYEVEVP